jgi:hypothetical protein
MTLKVGTPGTAAHPASGVETAAMVIGVNGDDTVWLALFPVAGSITERVRTPAAEFTPADAFTFAGALTPAAARDAPAGAVTPAAAPAATAERKRR